MPIKKYTKEKIEDLISKYGFHLYDNGEDYKNTRIKTTLIDNDGYMYYTPVCDIIGKSNYIPQKTYKGNPYSMQNIQLYMDTRPNSCGSKIYDNQQYKNQKTKFKIKCGKCGRDYFDTWNHLQYKDDCCCQKCGVEKRASSHRYSTEYVKEELKKNDLILLDEEVKNIHKINIMDKDGYKYSNVSFYNYISDGVITTFKRNRFAYFNLYTLENIQHYITLHGYNIKLVSTDKKKIKIRKENIECYCESCGKKFGARWQLIKTGNKTRCNDCQNNLSQIEYKTKLFLDELNIEYIQQKRFKNCVYKRTLPFDFYLPKYNICIEVQGQQHYYEQNFFEQTLEQRQKIDKIKKDYCYNNNIYILELPYWYFYYEIDGEPKYKEKIKSVIKELKEKHFKEDKI